jgi:hypothetical protein
MCSGTCGRCYQCQDTCNCVPLNYENAPLDKIDAEGVIYNMDTNCSTSNLMCFFGIRNGTNLKTILEKLDARLCQVRGLFDEKVKISIDDTSEGYLFDKVIAGNCITKTIVTNSLGRQQLQLAVDCNCVKICIDNIPNICFVPVFGNPVTICQGAVTTLQVNVINAGSRIVQFSSDEGITWINGSPSNFTFNFPSNGSLQKIKARLLGCAEYADGNFRLCSASTPVATPTATPTTPTPSTPIVVNCVALSSITFDTSIPTPTSTPIPITPTSAPTSTPVVTPVSTPVPTTPVPVTPIATPVSSPVTTPVNTPVLTPSYNKCNNILGWNSSTTTCSGNNTIFNVSVSGNNGEAVEFSTNSGVTYVPANVGTTNSYTYTATSTGNLVYFRARIIGCTTYIEGSLLSCSVTPVATPTSTPTSTPTATPIATPVTTPVATPVSTPVVTPVTTPVSTPISTPITAPVATPTSTPVSNLTERKSVYIGYPNLYTSNNDVYDKILNKFSNAINEIDSVYTSNGFNSGSNVYRTSSGTLFGTGYLAYFVGNILKKVKVTNGVVSEIESNVTVSPVINPSTTKVLAPFKHFNSGSGTTGYGYALYLDNGNFLYWMSKLEIAADGLTISDSAWGNSTGTSKYWKFNKEIVSATPLSTPYRIPEIYKGTVVEIQIVVLNTANPGSQNLFSYSLLIAK